MTAAARWSSPGDAGLLAAVRVGAVSHAGIEALEFVWASRGDGAGGDQLAIVIERIAVAALRRSSRPP